MYNTVVQEEAIREEHRCSRNNNNIAMLYKLPLTVVRAAHIGRKTDGGKGKFPRAQGAASPTPRAAECPCVPSQQDEHHVVSLPPLCETGASRHYICLSAQPDHRPHPFRWACCRARVPGAVSVRSPRRRGGRPPAGQAAAPPGAATN